MNNTAAAIDQGPWGQPDGSLGDFEDMVEGLVTLPAPDGVGRSPSDSQVRVVAGRLGAGKSLYLRRMQAAQSRNDSVFAAPYAKNSADLDTESIARFSEMMNINGGNTEAWKRLWRRSIVRSACSYLFAPKSGLSPKPSDEHTSEATEYQHLLGISKHPRRIEAALGEILQAHPTRAQMDKYLKHHEWNDVDALLAEALRETRPMYLYVDAVDDNFKWSPSLWTQCQRGLYYAVMDLLREVQTLGARLHVVIAVRDITLASIRASEHAPRFDEQTYTAVLRWDRQLMGEFVRAKLAKLPDDLFVDPAERTLESFVGREHVSVARRKADAESVSDYLLRHTRLVPRDIVVMGNRLCRFIRKHGHEALTEDCLRTEVGAAARDFALSQLAQASNQVWSDLTPLSAVTKGWAHVHLAPNDHQIAENRKLLLAAMESTVQEEFEADVLEQMEAVARELYGLTGEGAPDGADTHVGDILWQNAILGTQVSDECAFYSLGSIGQTSLPRDAAATRKYIWNPLVFDVLPGLEPVRGRPCWPQG